MRALVTGGHGFVGRHLAAHLLSCGDDVALTYYPGDPGYGNAVEIPRAVQCLALDITNSEMVNEVVSLLKPDAIYHLAGISFVPQGEKDTNQIFAVNLFGTTNLLDAVLNYSRSSRVLFVSSAEVYGSPRPGGLPFTENSELRPVSAYGVTKAAADLSAFRCWFREQTHIVRVRPFPHIGPGQSDSFALSGFAKQIAAIKLGQQAPVVQVGSLDPKRDYSDVSDIVRGYREALLNGKPGEAYNLCFGESLSIGEWLQMLIKLAGIEVELAQDASRVRKVDIADLYGSFRKANKDFGWKPRVEREAMLDSLLAYWLDTLSK